MVVKVSGSSPEFTSVTAAWRDTWVSCANNTLTGYTRST